MGFYSRVTTNFIDTEKPLYKMLHKDKMFQLSEASQQAFLFRIGKQVKRKQMTPKLLGVKEYFIVPTDARNV